MSLEDKDNKKEEKEETKEKGKGNKLIIFVISFLSLVIVLMAAALVVTIKILDGKEQVVVNEISPDYAKVVEDIEKYEVERNKAAEEGENEESEEEEEEGEEEDDLFGERQASYGAFYPLDDFVVNLADDAFLKIQIFVEFSSRDVPSNFIAKLVPIRDQVIEVLSGRKADSLKTLTGRDVLRNDIMQEINSIIGRSKDEVKNVYFTNFIVRN